MLAGTGHWTTARFCEVERKRLEAARLIAATNRTKHRNLDRQERLLRDLEAVSKKLSKAVLKGRPEATIRTLLRRRNRLVDALNAEV